MYAVMYVLMVILKTLSNTIASLFCCALLTSKRKWLFVVISTVYPPILIISLDYMGISDVTIGNPIISIGGFVISVISLLFIFEDKFTKKTLTFLLAVMIQSCVIYLAVPIFIYSGFVQWTPENTTLTPHFMIAQVIIISCLALISYLASKFLQKINIWIREDGLKLLTFFIITQTILLQGISMEMELKMGLIFDWLPVLIAIIVFCILADATVIYLLIEMGKKVHLQEQALFYQRQLSMQLALYQHFSDYSQTLEHTRLSLVDRLSNICNALETGKYEKAAEMSGQIPNSIDHLRITAYCQNSIINALLFVKHQEMKQANIDFIHSINLQEFALAKNSDLCSMLANVLDNAIEACRKLPSKDAPPAISLTCMPVQGTLVIKAQNPYMGELAWDKDGSLVSSKPEPGHGKGLKSIREIVTTYGGNLRIEADESQHVFTVVVTLFG